MRRPGPSRRLALLLPLALAACARASVDPLPASTAAAPPRLPRPAEIVVETYGVSSAQVALDSGRAQTRLRERTGSEARQRQQAIARAQQAFAAALVGELGGKGFEVRRGSAGGSGGAWPRLLVQGEFKLLDEGNRARRAAIGFSVGASRVSGETVLLLAEQGRRPAEVDRFVMAADSGAKPGAVVSAGAGAAAMAAGAVVRVGVEESRGPEDIRALARATAERILQVVAAQGWR